MINLLNYKSLIKVAIMIAVIALIGSQMMDTHAGRGSKKRDRDNNNNTSGGGNTNHQDVCCDEILAKLDVIIDGNGECLGAVPKTGQTLCYDPVTNLPIDCAGTGQEGDKLAGVDWPNPRFTDNDDGTIRDNLTCLIWDKNAFRFGQQTWANALASCNGLSDATSALTDGSVAGDWRLPNIRELQSLIHYGVFNPALPNTAGTGQHGVGGDTFNNVQSANYWSSTTHAVTTTHAWHVNFTSGFVSRNSAKINFGHVWCVRGGP